MPAREKYSAILVTGANSFYAAAIIDKLIQNGVKVHGAVRSERSAAPLRKKYGDAIEVFIVPNIVAEEAFHAAVRGCDGVIHVASPFRRDFKDAKTDMLDPAINGALTCLEAAQSEVGVSRVVLTSSIAACLDPTHPTGFKRPGYTYTEKDWNPLTYEEASKFSAFAPVYTASKALAEKAAWEWMRAAPRHFDMIAVNPCHTWGAYGQHVSSPGAMNFTNADLSRLMDGEEKELPHVIMPWMTDIDEVAQAHFNALYSSDAKGRYIVANSPYDMQQVVDVMHDIFRDSDWIHNVPKGNPGRVNKDEIFTLDNTRSKVELGVKYKPWKQSVVDFCAQYGEDRKRFV